MTKLQHFSLWISFLFFHLFYGLLLADGPYLLIAPAEYVAFSGDLYVQYKTPKDVSLPSAFIRLVLITYPLPDSGPEEITNLGMDARYKEGEVKVTCGIIEVAGKYEFHLYQQSGGPILTRVEVIVRWPSMQLQLPFVHSAHTNSVPLLINSTAACNPRLKRYSFQLRLEYAKNSSLLSIAGKEEEIYSSAFSTFLAKDLSVEFPCSLFDMAGVYRVSLISSVSAVSVVTRSNTMLTNWSSNFRIIIWTETVFPCYSNLRVNYVQPQCPGARHSNKIRMYKLIRKVRGSLAAPLERSYVEEQFVDRNKTSVYFSCSSFETAAAGYCFVYVTINRHGTVTNQTELCISAHPDSVLPIDGGWSKWSEWSDCSVSCGEGKSSRYRMCDSPTPNFGGAFCDGDSIQFKNCSKFCPESIPMTPLHYPDVDITCACGCEFHEPRGEIVASGRCEQLSRWLLITEENYYIKIRFKYFNLYENKQWVKIRNGGDEDSDLIAFSNGQSKLTRVMSTSNRVLIEFYTEAPPGNRSDLTKALTPVHVYPLKPTRAIHVHGFIASFSSNETGRKPHSFEVLPIRTKQEPSLWESTVTIVGIVLCSVIIVTALVFVIYYRACNERLHKYDIAMQEESPKHMCKSTSMHSTPSHVSSHGIEIEHGMEIPLTGGAVNGKKKKAYTPGSTRSRSSMASACSNNIKRLKTKVEVEYNARRQSPLTPNRDYSPVPQLSSPRKLSNLAEHEKNCGNLSLFRTSPLLKQKIPRSPKVHPSPKLKKSDNTPINSDFVTHPKRIVMGADITPSGTEGVISAPITIHPGDSETPTNINNGVAFLQGKTHQLDTSIDNPSALNSENSISLKHFDSGAVSDQERKPASGTSDESTSVEKDVSSEMTTSFIESGTKPRRPTSLTESYSKLSLASSVGKGSIDGSKDKNSVTSSDDRQNALPKPDGQSPKSPRVEVVKTSKSSTPKSVKSLRSSSTDVSSKTKSPARSINTPSDVVELEYDDFIDYDDTYSYFDPLETEKLTWHGVEKVGAKTPEGFTQTKKTHS